MGNFMLGAMGMSSSFDAVRSANGSGPRYRMTIRSSAAGSRSQMMGQSSMASSFLFGLGIQQKMRMATTASVAVGFAVGAEPGYTEGEAARGAQEDARPRAPTNCRGGDSRFGAS